MVEENQVQDDEKVIEQAARKQLAESMGGEVAPEDDAKEQEVVESQSQDNQDQKEIDSDSNEPDESSNDSDESNKTEQVKEEVRIAGYTEDEIRTAFSSIDKLRRALDTTNGRYGNELHQLKQTVKNLESRKDTALNGLTPEKLKRLYADYPEFAKLLVEDLSDIYSAEQPIKEPVQKETELQADPTLDRLSKLEQAQVTRAINDLTAAHPDWKELASYDEVSVSGRNVIQWTDPRFGIWVQNQSPEIQDVVFNGTDPMHLSAVITAYKQQNIKSVKDDEPDQQIKLDKQKPKPSLEKAILPQGAKLPNKSALTDEEIIEKAARDEMRRNMVGA